MHNTGNPLGSTQLLDLYDNSEVVDNFVNSQQDETPDRFGQKRLTLAGLIKRSMALRNEINDFSGGLTFKPEWSDVPMNVSEGVGGEGGALNLQAEALGNRTEINKITSREALRRTYQEVGLNLVEGSFEQGGTLQSATDVILEEKTGKVYSGTGPYPQSIPSNSNPAGTLFIESTKVTSDFNKYSNNLLSSISPVNSEVKVKKIDRSFSYSIIPNSSVLGDGDILVDRADGLQGQLVIDGALDVKAFYRPGRTDQQVLQAALDYAGSKSGNWVVAITPKMDNTPWGFTGLHIGNSTVLQGHGGRLRLNDNVCVDTSKKYYPIENLGCDDVWVDGMYIDGNMSKNTLFTVADLLTLTGNRSKATNNWLLNAPDSGLMFSSVKDGSAIGNHIIGGTDCGIYANSSSDGGSRNTIISNNVISNFGSTGIGFKRHFSDCMADGNSIQLCGNGITFEDFGDGSNPKRININGLFMRDIGYVKRAAGIAERGISVGKAEDIKISNFVAINVSGDVLYIGSVSGGTFSNGTIRGYTPNPHPSGNNGVRVLSATDSEILNMNVTGVADRAGYFSNMQRCSIISGTYVSSGIKSGVRVDADCDLYDFAPTRIHGGSGSDLEWFEGAKGRAENFRLTNASGVAAYGFVALSSGTAQTPVGYLTPRFIGQRIFVAFDKSWWISHGMTNVDWKPIT